MKVFFLWSPQALSDIRNIDRQNAMRILDALTRYARAKKGDVSALHGPLAGAFRLRVGLWRVRFEKVAPDTLLILEIEKGAATSKWDGSDELQFVRVPSVYRRTS